MQLLRRAALVHDIGRVTVPVRVWAKPGPLTRDEREQVRLHAYHSERVLDVAVGLRPLARLAGSHGERCDGSGYHRGSRAADLPLTAWLLAAAWLANPYGWRMSILLVEQYLDFCLEIADRFYVMDRGAIVARGDHAQLYSANELYRALYDRQRTEAV